MPLAGLEYGINKWSILPWLWGDDQKTYSRGWWKVAEAERGGCPAAGGDRAQRRPLPKSAHRTN